MKNSRTWGVVFLLGFCLCGCQPAERNPWSVQRYRPPSEYKPVPQATYAPMPSILPSVSGGSTESIEAGAPDELEQILNELQID
ncbi:MAG: hypothetical protein P8J27_08070 [Mariniblastus sp.]|nr:hypothetical protein [Mariniblastus sp.]